MAGQSDGHPEADLLAAFAERSLGNAEREYVLAHLAQCELCREVVALALPPLEAAPAAIAVRRRWLSAPYWYRWGAAVAALAVISAALWLRRPEPKLPTSDAQIVQVPPSSPAAPSLETAAPAPAPSRGTRAAKRAPQAETGFGETAKALPSAPAADEMIRSARPADSGFHTAAVAPMVSAAPNPAAGGAMDMPTVGAAAAASPPGRMAAKSVGSSAWSNAQAQSDRAAAAAMETRMHRETARALEQAPAAPSAASRASAPFYWSISSAGKLQRSRDQLHWQTVEVTAGVAFRTVASIGNDVWAGGSGGALYHSGDNGDTWQRVPVGLPANLLRDAITRLDFSDASTGTLATTAGDEWSTVDGGHTWLQKAAH
jgi:hypothetical protein